jgi:FXSXX-COOH protein
MSDDAQLAGRRLPDLSRSSLRDLRASTSSALDVALSRLLAEDDATSEASAGFNNRI